MLVYKDLSINIKLIHNNKKKSKNMSDRFSKICLTYDYTSNRQRPIANAQYFEIALHKPNF